MGGNTIEKIEKLIEEIVWYIEEGRFEEAQKKLNVLEDKIREIPPSQAMKIMKSVEYITTLIGKKRLEILQKLSNFQKLSGYRF